MTQPPKGIGITLLTVTIIMLTLSTVTLALRLTVRTWTRQMGSDDYLMIAGLVRFGGTAGGSSTIVSVTVTNNMSTAGLVRRDVRSVHHV